MASDDKRRYYSGQKSKRFWARVLKLGNREIYALGCVLQLVEHRTLAALDACERETRRKAKHDR